jgi:hypothetical protein
MKTDWKGPCPILSFFNFHKKHHTLSRLASVVAWKTSPRLGNTTMRGSAERIYTIFSRLVSVVSHALRLHSHTLSLLSAIASYGCGSALLRRLSSLGQVLLVVVLCRMCGGLVSSWRWFSFPFLPPTSTRST